MDEQEIPDLSKPAPLPDLSKPAPLAGATPPGASAQNEAQAPAAAPPASKRPSDFAKGCLTACLVVFVVVLLVGIGIIVWFNNAMHGFGVDSSVNTEQFNKSQAWIANVQQKKLPNFDDWIGISGNYGAVGCDSTDQCIGVDSTDDSNLDEAAFCSQLIDYAKSLSATTVTWNTYRSPKASAIDDTTQQACVDIMKYRPRFTPQSYYSGEFLLHGSDTQKVPFVISATAQQRSRTSYMTVGQEQLAPVPPPHGKGVLAAERIGFGIVVSTEFDPALSPSDPNNVVAKAAQAADLLNAMIYYRPSNTDLDVHGAKFVKAVIADWNARYNYGADAKPFVGADGKVDWFEISTKDGFHACVATFPNPVAGYAPPSSDYSIDTGMPYDVGTYNGMDTSMKEIKSMSDSPVFGSYVLGSCKAPTS